MARGMYYNDTTLSYPDDIKSIKESIPEISNMDDSIIETLWEDYSTTWWAAGWIGSDDYNIGSFKRYLFTSDQC